MKLVKSKIRYKIYGHHEPHTAILHHTAGSRVGSESYLKQQGLGYHYMIDKDGSVYSYNGPNDIVGHASKANRGYIGISYISGGALGPTNESQIQASIALLKVLRRDYGIEKVSNHATIDKIIAKRGWKSDPFYAGEKSEANDWKIKNSQLDVISKETGLTPVKYNPVLTMLPILNNTYPSSILMDDIDLGD